MNEKNLDTFKYSCKEYFSSLSIGSLRAYGRYIGVRNSTELKKLDLIDQIISILTGESEPIPRTNRGAPVKDVYVDPKIVSEIEKLRLLHFSRTENVSVSAGNNAQQNNELYGNGSWYPFDQWQKKGQGKNVLRFEDPDGDQTDLRQKYSHPVYRGQLETLNGVSLLLPLNCMDSGEKIIISVELIRKYDLREGDIVTCHAEKSHNALVATDVMTVNDRVVGTFKRSHFDTCEACYPSERISLYEDKADASDTAKYLQWLIPLGKGQRGCVLSEPKAGKTKLLLEIAKSAKLYNRDLHILILLIDQSPENVGEFRKISNNERLVYTTYDDEPERQVFVAEFLLKRAKRLAEGGTDVLLLVDSLNSLARAYNDTDDSAGGRTLSVGLESKTIHYIKKYFGTARCLEQGGSITILGSLSMQTGNPADDLIAAELSSIANLEIRLNNELAIKRIYPAVDLKRSYVKQGDLLRSPEEEEFDFFIRNSFLTEGNETELLQLVNESDAYAKFTEKAKKQIKSK